MDQEPRVVVSAIIIKKDEDGIKIFTQARWKPESSPTYSGMIEIPAGGIDSYENVYDALKREIKEECSLDIVRIINDYQGPITQIREKDKFFAFKPFICQQALETDEGLPWVGFVFLCEAKGDVRLNPHEAKDPAWLSLNELADIVHNKPDTIFPLQLPVLQYFLEWSEKNEKVFEILENNS
ncbi:MAG: NUDIX domain-containing protein [Candidatus Wolfebacteria bacterium]|nr:NUDIX domain-containing protein [Candidatus Wolfebacteria bacterium]